MGTSSYLAWLKVLKQDQTSKSQSSGHFVKYLCGKKERIKNSGGLLERRKVKGNCKAVGRSF